MGKVEIFKIILGVEKMCWVEEVNSLNPQSLPAGKEKKKVIQESEYLMNATPHDVVS